MLAIPKECIDLLLKLLTATVLSGAIGLEREFHGRAAGIRTHILVCLGATIIMAISQVFQVTFSSQGAESVFRIDPWRIAAGIVTGIGFLGGGAILKSNDLIRGLTTAACIWFVAAIGIVIGIGLFVPAIMVTTVALFVLIGLHPFGRRIPSLKYGKIEIGSSLESAENIESRCLQILRKHSIVLQDTSVSACSETGERKLVLYIRSRGKKNKHAIIKQILSTPNVQHVIW